MDLLLIQLSETFEFLQPFCSVAMHKQAAFESAPLVKATRSTQTLATETDMTQERPEASFAKVQYLQDRCDTSLTSSISEDEMILPYDPSLSYFPNVSAGPVPENITFFAPKKEISSHALSHLSLQWHVKRAVGGFKGIDEWTGRLCDVADARQDTDGFLGHVSCFRISPNFVLPSNKEQMRAAETLHPTLAALSQYMKVNTTLSPLSTRSQEQQEDKDLFGLPLVLITQVEVMEESRGLGLGLLLVDETCRCLANPAQWVLLGTQEEGLREYFGLLGFTASGLLEGQVIVRWNDPYCMATHRYEDLCPHLPRVAIQ